MYIIYGKENCSQCVSAKKLLESQNYDFRYVTFGSDDMTKERLEEMTNYEIRTVPQILHSDNGFFRYVGGLKELMEDIKNA